jgi:ATP-dependent DNA helicase RecG
MVPENLHEILQKGENTEVEFKTSLFELSKSAFESISAFLNRKGGHLLLGIKDTGDVEGIIEDCVAPIINNIITNANNPQKLNPPFYLSPQVIDYEGKKIIYLYVPESSQVHSTNGKIFDRNEDGDFEITSQSAQVTQLYLRKQTTYSENRIYPYIKQTDFKQELFSRIRTLAKNERPDHSWLEMTDKELLRSAGLFKHDYQTGKEGYTLASVLLLGKDEVIQNVISHYKTDAILRVHNIDRYDDRDEIRTNLIESYDRLMAFIRKHLPDKFYQEGAQRISLRDRIFREVVGNLLIHREYTNAFPAKLIIEKGRVYAENWNRPHGSTGLIDPANFSPYPKNPVIAKFFKEIGRIDELGSGIRNTFKYCGIYTPGTNPEFIEGDVFNTIVPLETKEDKVSSLVFEWDEIRERLGNKLGNKLGDRLGDNEWKILKAIWENPSCSIPEIARKVGISTTAVENNLKKLRIKELIGRVGTPRAGYWKINM